MEKHYESSGEECGIDGEPKEFITVDAQNRFIRRFLINHYRPLKREIKELSEWNNEANKVIDQFKGGFMVAKFIGVTVVALLAWLINMVSKLSLL